MDMSNKERKQENINTENAKQVQVKSENGNREQAGPGKIVLCGANAYEQKYYFNEQFQGIPQSIQDELHIICVLFTEEVGGIFTIVFEEDGTLALETRAEENDIYYDEVGSGLLVGEIRRKRQELLESLSLYYRVFVLHEDVSGLLEEET